jgi:hypothetical protein
LRLAKKDRQIIVGRQDFLYLDYNISVYNDDLENLGMILLRARIFNIVRAKSGIKGENFVIPSVARSFFIRGKPKKEAQSIPSTGFLAET